VFAVTSLNRQGFKANYANYGSQVALATVGGDAGDASNPVTCDVELADSGIASTSNQGSVTPAAFGYAAGSGTSFAAPVVAGVASLMLAANPGLSLAQLEDGLTRSARPHVKVPYLGACNAAGNHGRCQCTTSTCGAGTLDAEQALVFAASPATYTAPTRTAYSADTPQIRQCAALLGLPAPTPAPPASQPSAPSGGGTASGSGGGALGVPWLLALLAAVVLTAAAGAASKRR
jgi:serine protease